MACCRALALQLLPASAHSRAQINFHRRIRCCAAAGDQVEAPRDAVLKAISLSTPFGPKSGWKAQFSISFLYIEMEIFDSCRRWMRDLSQVFNLVLFLPSFGGTWILVLQECQDRSFPRSQLAVTWMPCSSACTKVGYHFCISKVKELELKLKEREHQQSVVELEQIQVLPSQNQDDSEGFPRGAVKNPQKKVITATLKGFFLFFLKCGISGMLYKSYLILFCQLPAFFIICCIVRMVTRIVKNNQCRTRKKIDVEIVWQGATHTICHIE